MLPRVRGRRGASPLDGDLRSSVAGGAAGKAVELVTLIALAVVVPRLMGPADYGRFAVALTVVTLGSLALTLGGHTLMARYVPAAPEQERVGLALALGRRFARGRAVPLAGAVMVGATMTAVAPATFETSLTALVLVALVANVATTLLLQVGLGLGRTGLWSARYPVQNALVVVGALVLYPTAGLTGAVAGLAVAGFATLGVGAWLLAPTLAAGPVGAVDVPDGAIRFGSLQAAGAALTQVTHRGGVLAVAVLAGSTVETGNAALAVGIALGATYAILQLFTVALPHLSDADRRGDEAEKVLRRVAGGALVVIVPGALAVAGALTTLVPLVFGDDYRGATSAFGPALGIVVLAPVSSLLVQVSALRLQPGVALAAGATSAAVFVVTALVAVPASGAAGGTAATLAGVAASTVVSARALPGAVGGRLVAVSAVAAALVTAIGALA